MMVWMNEIPQTGDDDARHRKTGLTSDWREHWKNCVAKLDAAQTPYNWDEKKQKGNGKIYAEICPHPRGRGSEAEGSEAKTKEK